MMMIGVIEAVSRGECGFDRKEGRFSALRSSRSMQMSFCTISNRLYIPIKDLERVILTNTNTAVTMHMNSSTAFNSIASIKVFINFQMITNEWFNCCCKGVQHSKEDFRDICPLGSEESCE